MRNVTRSRGFAVWNWMGRGVLIAVVAGSLSCARHVPTASVPPVTSMDRQIANAVDAGEGDYLVRGLRRKMTAEPENLEVRLALIRHFAAAGHADIAVEHARLASPRFPQSADLHVLLAQALRSLKLYAEAASALEQFLAAHSQAGAETYSWMGILHDESGNWRAGEIAHRAALERDPRADSLHNNLGYNLLRQGRALEGAAQFREALRLRPSSEVARNNLGLAMAGQPAEAILHWQSVADPATAHSNLAALYIEQGRHAEARKEIDMALGYNRNHAAALTNLQLVSQLDGKPAIIPIRPVRSRWAKFRSAVRKAVGG